jgi:hypothetical protein
MRWVLLYAALNAAPALADNPASPIPLADLYPPLPGVEYYCTDSAGERVEIGGVICVVASCQTWMARYEMTASNRLAMWRKIQDGCPGATVLQLGAPLSPAMARLKALQHTL